MIKVGDKVRLNEKGMSMFSFVTIDWFNQKHRYITRITKRYSNYEHQYICYCYVDGSKGYFLEEWLENLSDSCKYMK